MLDSKTGTTRPVTAPDPVELTQRLIGFETVNPPGNERACAEFLANLLDRNGFKTDLVALADDRCSVIATRQGRQAGLPLAFTGHLDVVPLGSAPWTHAPFAGAIVDDKLYGRGSSDMKSGIAAFICAALAEPEAIDAGTGLTLVLTAGEETGCAGAIALVAAGRILPAGALVVGEPTANVICVGHKGALWLRGVTRGITAHGSMPQLGDNAIYKAARAIDRLSAYAFTAEPHPALGRPTLNVGTITGGLNINSVPDRTEFGIDIRTIPGLDHAWLRDDLRRHGGPDLDLETIIDLPGIWTEADQPWVRDVARQVADISGLPERVAAATYFTDAAVLSPAMKGMPTLILGPGEPGQAHQTDEWCDTRRIHEAATIYRRIIRRWNDPATRT